jgi:hypothetical protein
MPAVVGAPPACGIYPSANNKLVNADQLVSKHAEDPAWPIVNQTFGAPYANMLRLSPSTLVLGRPQVPAA